MKGYKAFRKGLVCNNKQYKENTVFEEKEAVICKEGMHFCKNPLDVLDYYPLLDVNNELSEFAEVEALDETKTDDNKKYCTKKLKIGAKLDLGGFIKAAVDFSLSSTKDGGEPVKAASGYGSKLAASGNDSQLAASGEHSVMAGIGINNIAKGKKGCWIVLAEWVYDNKKDAYIPKYVKSKKIDGKTIKEDTFYKLKDGKFVEV